MALLRSYLPFDDKQTDMVLIALAGAAFLGSVLAGTWQTGPDQNLPIVDLDMVILSTALWAGLGLIALALFREVVEDIWLPNGALLVGTYVATGLGAVFLTVGFDEGLLWWVVGLMLVGIGILLIIQLWLAVYTDRAKLIRANPEVDPETFALGSWNFVLPLFILATLLTFYSWSLWYQEREFWRLDLDPLYLYILLDAITFGVAIVLLYIPQQSLGRYFIREVEPIGEAEALLRPGGGLPRKMAKQLSECLHCQSTTRIEQRACPSCEAASNFGWCPACEHFSVICPECGTGSLYGQDCTACGNSLTSYNCPSCANSAPLRQWSAR